MRCFCCMSLALALASALGAQELVISEFMAANDSTLTDEDGEFSDWIEVYNAGPQAADLAGWSLTDDADELSKWPFPAIHLAPRHFLTVFASGKDRRASDRPLHTNFRLSRSGEFLALGDPGGRLVSSYAPEFPEQRADASFGLPMAQRVDAWVAAGAQARFLVPSSEDELPAEWNVADFDDASWTEGPTAIGFDRNSKPAFDSLIATDVGDLMHRNNASIFVRLAFDLEAAPEPPLVRLRVRYDGGFIAHFNGVEVARRNAPRDGFNASAGAQAANTARRFDEIPLLLPEGLLRPGRNVLAVQAMNTGAFDSDFLFLPVLEFVEVLAIESEAPLYFAAPSPGFPNRAVGEEGLADEPEILTAQQAFHGSIRVELAASSPNAELRYTLDGSQPLGDSPRYTAALELSESTRVRVRNFEPGLVPSLEVTAGYIALADEVVDFSSNLPLVLVESFGKRIPEEPMVPMHLQIVEGTDEVRSSLLGEVHFSGGGAIKIRGSSTANRGKASYAFEIRGPGDEDRAVELLGMPADSDWILYGPHNFDRALVRNPFIYELSNRIGRYAVRTRFCEAFVNTGSPQVTLTQYAGVYVLMEKIKRGEHRVDVEPLSDDRTTEPEVTGGYIFKLDRPDPRDLGFEAGGERLYYVEPKEEEILERPAQQAWLTTHLNRFEEALQGENSADPELGYARFIDVDAWIDFHLLNVFAKNPDHFVLSTYFHKPRGRALVAGPVWDFDRSLAPNDDGRAQDPVGWLGNRLAGWWGLLLGDEAFDERYRARWRELRQGVFTTGNLHTLLDAMTDQVREAQVRNFEHWFLDVGEGGWQVGQVDRLKEWVARRVEWMDSALTPLPRFSHPGGHVEPGLEVTLRASVGQVHYTIDGTDPRTEAGEPAVGVIVYNGVPVVIQENTVVRARTRTASGLWSDLVEAFYIVLVPRVVISEVMYNPPPAPEGSPFANTAFQYVELLNAGEESVDLTALRFRVRQTFDFSTGSVASLAPGEYVLLVKNLEAFRTRYDVEGLNIAGEFEDTLSRRTHELNVVIVLLGDTHEEPVVRVRYIDSWYPATDGEGPSLVLADPLSAKRDFAEAADWRASAAFGGSPGRPDGEGGGQQLPGDVHQDGRINLLDAIQLLAVLQGDAALPCDERGSVRLADGNGDGGLDLSDALQLVNRLFLRGPPHVLGNQCVSIAGCPSLCTRS